MDEMIQMWVTEIYNNNNKIINVCIFYYKMLSLKLFYIELRDYVVLVIVMF